MKIRLQIFKKNGGELRSLSFAWDRSKNKTMVLLMKTMILIRWLPAIFRVWYIHKCLLGSYCSSADFAFGVFSLLIIMAQRTIPSRSQMWGHWSKVWDKDTTTQQRQWSRFVSLLFALNMFHATVYCFGCWLWACKRLRGFICCKHLLLHFLQWFWFGKSWAIDWLVLWIKYYERNSAKTP